MRADQGWCLLSHRSATQAAVMIRSPCAGKWLIRRCSSGLQHGQLVARHTDSIAEFACPLHGDSALRTAQTPNRERYIILRDASSEEGGRVGLRWPAVVEETDINQAVSSITFSRTTPQALRRRRRHGKEDTDFRPLCHSSYVHYPQDPVAPRTILLLVKDGERKDEQTARSTGRGTLADARSW